MNFNKDQRFIRWFIIFAAVVITALILWNVSLFFDQLKQSERDRMEIWATSMEAFNTEDINQYYALSQKINSKNQYIPIIITDYKDSIVNSINIPENILENPARSQELLLEMAAENDPIRIDILGGELWYAYYGHSPVINQLKFFPVVLVIIVILFIAVIYFFYATSKASEQNSLWAGMAKETAHQIGTPLSSLVGWTEILKAEHVNPDYIEETNTDINRPETITGRFSQIGSIPKLDPKNIITETQDAFEYLANRSSKLIDFEIDVPRGQLFVMLNKELYAWSIENLVKNAIDAMKGKGKLTLTIKRDTRYAKILISDTGKGIPKMNFNTIFEPGYTTKKRGWGLGLSLTKRIIEEYHDGQVRVLQSELNKGTTFQIALKLIDE